MLLNVEKISSSVNLHHNTEAYLHTYGEYIIINQRYQNDTKHCDVDTTHINFNSLTEPVDGFVHGVQDGGVEGVEALRVDVLRHLQ